MTDSSGKQALSGVVNPTRKSSDFKTIWGTMRIADNLATDTALDNHLVELFEHGINTHHVSSEYDSFDKYCDAIKRLTPSRRKRLQVVCKLGEPHFDSTRFSWKKLTEKVDSYLSQLSIDAIEIVQWMWRQNPLNDDTRCALLGEQQEEISDAFETLVCSGKVKEFGCFPYTERFMEATSIARLTNLQFNYLNLLESDGLTEEHSSVSTIAIRPFAAGKLPDVPLDYTSILDELGLETHWSLAEHSLAYVRNQHNVRGVILGLNNIQQIHGAVEVLNSKRSSEALSSYIQLRATVATNT